MLIGGQQFATGGPPAIVGVLNLSPESPAADSVAGGPAAVERARRLADAGARIVDVGARSSNYATADTTWREELRRIVPVVERLKEAGFLVSVDSWDARVIRTAARAGADLVNDADGLQSPAMIEAVAEAGVPVVVPFLNGPNPRRVRPIQPDRALVVIVPWLRAALARAREAGVEDVILDPGTGYARRELSGDEHDRYQRLVHGNLGALRELGRPLFVALPRRRTRPREGVALARQLAEAGADFIRAHDVHHVTTAIASTAAAGRS